MSKQKTTGEFSKVGKLIFVLEKCNGKAAIGSSEALISPKAAKILAAVSVILLNVILAGIAFLLEPVMAPYIALRDLTNSLMMLMLLFSLLLSVKNIVSVLYTSDDLSALMPMPFSAGQIVVAKLAVSIKFPVIFSFVIMNATFLGLGIRAGMGAAYVIGTVFSSILIPVTGMAIATLLMVVIFKIFGFIRNRDVMVWISGILTLLLTVAYPVFSNLFGRGGSAHAAMSVLSAISDISDSFVNISFMSGFMFDGHIAGLFISIAVTLAVVTLMMFVVKLFYFSTALSMQNTGAGKKAVSKSALANRKQAGVKKALTAYEAKNARRNPSYMIYGFAMTFMWPLFFGLPFFFGNNAIFSEIKLPFHSAVAPLAALFLGLTASCCACGFNILAGTAFSREGNAIHALRTMPVDFKDYYRSKRNFAMWICSLGSVAYVLILGVVCAVTGVVSVGSSCFFLYGACISFLCNSIIINCLLVHNAKRPVFHWDSETEISRKLCWINIVAIIVGFVMYFVLFSVIFMSLFLDKPDVALNKDKITAIILIVSVLFVIILLAIAVAVDRCSVRRAEKSLAEFE